MRIIKIYHKSHNCGWYRVDKAKEGFGEQLEDVVVSQEEFDKLNEGFKKIFPMGEKLFGFVMCSPCGGFYELSQVKRDEFNK